MMQLRDYQQEAVDSIFRYFESNHGMAPICVLPTGAGKSLVAAAFCKQAITDSPHIRIMVVTDSKELVAQNEAEMKRCWPEAKTGIYSAGLKRKETNAQILFAGIQSIYSKVFDLEKIDIIICDECHMIGREDVTRYGKFFADMRVANPNIAIVGLTATPFRRDSGYLHIGEDALFDGICYEVPVSMLIERGFLCPVISKGGCKEIDLSNVHLRGGEYANNELAHAASDPILVKLACSEIAYYGRDRKSWLVFGAGVEHAGIIAAEFKKLGVASEIVTGDSSYEDRDSAVARFKSGDLKVLINVGVFTKGFNAPKCDLLAMMFATTSPVKYIQVVGRCMRTADGKENALLLDYGGNVLRHGPIDNVNIRFKQKNGDSEKQEAPAKMCPQCRAVVPIQVTTCECGYEFPFKPNHEERAYSGAVLQSQFTPERVEVSSMTCSRHKKSGRPDMVKMTFVCGLRHYYKILTLDHGDYPAEKSAQIVRLFGGRATTVDDALEEWPSWRKIREIEFTQNTKFPDYPEIRKYIFEATL